MKDESLHVLKKCHTPAPPGGTSMKVSILPLNSLWLYWERGLGFRIFCGLGGRVGGLGMIDKGGKKMPQYENGIEHRNKHKDLFANPNLYI